ECQVVGEKDRAHPPFAEQALDLVLPLHEPLQPLHQAFGCAGARTHRAAAGHVGTAGVAEFATVREWSVALETFHHGARGASPAHGRPRRKNEPAVPTLAPTDGAASRSRLLDARTGGPGRMRLHEPTVSRGTSRMHSESRSGTPAKSTTAR